MPVAVKTMVFEAWEGDDSSSGGAAANKAQLRYVRAIMETALSASLGHPHVVGARRRGPPVWYPGAAALPNHTSKHTLCSACTRRRWPRTTTT